MISSILDLNSRLLGALRADQFAGHDPFDYLNSRLLQATPLRRSELARLAWLQLGKRLPINLRPLLGVPRLRNPKGVGLCILGLLEDYRRTGEQPLLQAASELGDWLMTQRPDRAEWQYSCWGYHFDWQARAFYVPAGKPNMITSVYVAQALYALSEVTGNRVWRTAALEVAKFISSRLLTEADGRRFFAYIPGETAFVHNASLWGAAWCAFAGQQLGDTAMVEQALDVARQSVSEQGADGSWVYGARHHHQFIDGFHTGYNLEALALIRDALDTSEFDASIELGLAYYRDHFFTEDGTAKYYHNAVYPLDMHNFTQAVFTLLKVGGTAEDIALCEKVMHRGIELMYLPRQGRFVYQKHRWYTNKIDYMRWTQAWAYYALAYYNRFCVESGSLKD